MSIIQRRGAPPALNGTPLADTAGETGLGAAITLTDVSKVYGRGPARCWPSTGCR